jgi:hypothetical protein
MPQPLKGQGAEFRPNPILDRPNAAAHLANALVVWSLFEWELSWLFSAGMGFYVPSYEGWEPVTLPAAQDVMDTVAGFGTRLDLIETLLKRLFPYLVDEFVALRPQMRREAGRRAKLAHGRWGINDAYPDDLILDAPEGFIRWTAKDFDNRADGFNQLRDKLSKFSAKIREALMQRKGLKQPPELFQKEAEPPQER